jgi:cold shock CspA family protein
MTLDKIFRNYPSEEDDTPTDTPNEKIKGKIYHLNDDTKTGGYGFISSESIPFTRIFFHWQALENDTLHFIELRNGMEVEFKVFKHPELGYRAIKVRVIE